MVYQFGQTLRKHFTIAFAVVLVSAASSVGAFSDIELEVDTTQVKKLLTLSKELQWKDSYRSLEYANQALVLSQQLDYKFGIAAANNLRGFCFWSFGDNDLAIQAALEANSLAAQENNLLLQAESSYILARGYMDVSESEKAHVFIDQAEQLAQASKDSELLCSIYNLKGVLFFIDNRVDSALIFYNKALDLGRQQAVDPINFPRIISNIGECYVPENQVLAFQYFNQALGLAEETGNQIAKASITAIIGQAYLRKKDFGNAEKNFLSALRLARSLGLRRVMRHAYGGLVDIKLQKGQGNEAVVYLQKYYAVRDSLINTSKVRQIVELESKHALELKEQNIKILEGEKRIQTLWNNLLILLLIFILAASVGVYLWQRYRYQKNREILNLEIDYLTQQHQETVEKFKATLTQKSDEVLESHDQKLLKRAIAIVETNIGDPQFSVEKLAMDMNMSRTNLHRKIKSITGFPPSELIRSIRLRKAARLIVGKVDSVTQIALLVGFDDYSHFSKAFKKHFGVSPTNYEAGNKPVEAS